VGCVFLVAGPDRTAQLRLLLVHPDGRGQGLGGRLVDTCLRFARDGRLPGRTAVDQRPADRRAHHLSRPWLHPDRRGTAPQLRRGPRRADLRTGPTPRSRRPSPGRVNR
jgi:GNAT superfamily N-acetyltransferase